MAGRNALMKIGTLMRQEEILDERRRRSRAWRNGLRCLLSLLILISAAPAYAHKVNVFAYVEGAQVYVQGYFLDGKKTKNSAVVVYGENDARLAEGVTNGEGEYVFNVIPNQDMRIVLNAGQGHQAEYRLSVADIAGGELHDTPLLNDASVGNAESGAHVGAPVTGSGNGGNIEAVVRRAVTESMLPMARELAELKERRGLSDIIGGLGFIIGILGVFAYLKSRKPG